MNHHTINPVAQNNPSTPSAASAEANQPQPTEACQQVYSVSDEDRIKAQSCLALARTQAAYMLGYRYLQEYAIFQKRIDSEQPETIDRLMSRAEAMPIQILKDKAYQAIALKKHLNVYFRMLAIEKISSPMQRLEIALDMFKMSPSSCTQENYYAVLQDFLPEEWKANACSLEIDPANPLSLNDLGAEALRGLDLNSYTNQIEFLTEEELQFVLTQLDNCYLNLFKKDVSLDAVSSFLDIATGPYGHIPNLSNKVLDLLRKIHQQSQFVPTAILEKVPEIYSSLIKDSSFLPIVCLEILKTMRVCKERTALAEYLLTDPCSPVVLELRILQSSTIETPIATSYLECIRLLEDDLKIDQLLETIYQLPIFNHRIQFYLLLLGLERSEIAKTLIKRTENKETHPNYPESDEIIEGKYQALVTAKQWFKMGVQDFSNCRLRGFPANPDHT
jgi:hypothetical protein